MKDKKRIFVAVKPLYLYDDDNGWVEENPSEYAHSVGLYTKSVRDGILLDEIRKGTKFYLKKTDNGDLIDYEAYPYCLRSIHGKHVVGYETIADVESDPLFREAKE